MDHSAEINELAAALAKAQGAITTAAKDKTNPFLKSSYADLASVMAAARSHLSANGLAVIQTAETTNAGVSVTTMLAHASGQWISGTMSMAAGEERGKSSAQVLGSIVTYLRRYGYMAITGVVADDDDDDGNSAAGRPVAQPAPKAEAPKAEPPKVDVLAIRELVQAEAKRRDNGTAEPASDQQKTLIRMFIPEATGRKSGPDADQDRHLFLEYLTGNKSSTEITRGYAGAILDQLVDKGNITTDAKGKPLYHISADGKRIVNAVITEAMRGQGQQELAEVTELAAELGGLVAK